MSKEKIYYDCNEFSFALLKKEVYEETNQIYYSFSILTLGENRKILNCSTTNIQDATLPSLILTYIDSYISERIESSNLNFNKFKDRLFLNDLESYEIKENNDYKFIRDINYFVNKETELYEKILRMLPHEIRESCNEIREKVNKIGSEEF